MARARTRSALGVLLLAAAALSFSLDGEEEAPVVPAGHDAAVYCRACCLFVGNLQERLLPALEASVRRSEALKQSGARSRTFGELDELADELVDAGCRWSSTHHDPPTRKSCEHIVDSAGEQVAAALSRWARDGRPREEVLPLVCRETARACQPDDLHIPDMRGLGPENKTRYRSERPPEMNDGATYVMVGESLARTLEDSSRDVLAYFYFPSDDRHFALSPRFERLAELMWAMPNAPSTFRFAKVNARANELPPPHGHKIRRSSLFLYPGVERTTEQVSIEWLEPVEHDLAHILAQLKSAFTLEHSRRHVANLHVALGEELVHAAKWWEDPRLLDAVRRADNGQRPTPLKPRHERKNEL